MSKLHQNILKTIGNTPVVKINKLAPEGINLYVKIESFNPMGSVKDRLALGVIEAAERSGELKPGQTVIEATSGNTGLGLAMVCAQKGYPLVVTMAENFSVERRKMMRFLGVKVVLTPAANKGTGMLAKAVELAEKHGWFLCRQFENEANANIHSETTALEILNDFSEVGLDYWVTGYGTGGTLRGVSRVLKLQSPKTQVVVCEPENSALLNSGIRPEISASNLVPQSHPSFRPHVMQGWTPDFIAKLADDVIGADHIDSIVPVNGDKALSCAKDLANKEGIFVGISAGATFSGAIQVCQQAPNGSNILCMLPDTGERYLTTQLFDNIAEEMSEEEVNISRSTNGYRFDVSSTAPATSVSQLEVSIEATEYLNGLLDDKEQPVILFALEWCEFCWSVRKFLNKLNIQFRSVDLDSVEYQENDWGGKVRAALNAKSGCITIPQIFIGGQFIGGCTELFDSFNEKQLHKTLESQAVNFDNKLEFDAYNMLPKWLHPR